MQNITAVSQWKSRQPRACSRSTMPVKSRARLFATAVTSRAPCDKLHASTARRVAPSNNCKATRQAACAMDSILRRAGQAQSEKTKSHRQKTESNTNKPALTDSYCHCDYNSLAASCIVATAAHDALTHDLHYITMYITDYLYDTNI